MQKAQLIESPVSSPFDSSRQFFRYNPARPAQHGGPSNSNRLARSDHNLGPVSLAELDQRFIDMHARNPDPDSLTVCTQRQFSRYRVFVLPLPCGCRGASSKCRRLDVGEASSQNIPVFGCVDSANQRNTTHNAFMERRYRKVLAANAIALLCNKSNEIERHFSSRKIARMREIPAGFG